LVVPFGAHMPAVSPAVALPHLRAAGGGRTAMGTRTWRVTSRAAVTA